MTPAAWILSISTALYGAVVLAHLVAGNLPMAVVFGGYAASNLGFIYMEVRP